MSAQKELDRRARAYAEEHGLKYSDGVVYILQTNPALAAEYEREVNLGQPIEREVKRFTHPNPKVVKKYLSGKEAEAELVRRTELRMLECNLSFNKSWLITLKDPTCRELVQQYMALDTLREVDPSE